MSLTRSITLDIVDMSTIGRQYTEVRESVLPNVPKIDCLRCCHISPDSANGRRTDRKNAKNVYPVEKVVSVAMKVVAEGVRSA